MEDANKLDALGGCKITPNVRDGLIHTTYSVHSDHSYEVVRFLGYFEFIAAENYRIP